MVHPSGETGCESYARVSGKSSGATIPLSESLRLMDLAKRCDYRRILAAEDRIHGCGCDAICLAGKSPKPNGTVTINDCLECLRNG